MCRSSKPRILCIDDDSDACKLIVLMPRTADDSYDVATFTDPEKAIIFLRTQPVALFILDYALTEMTGVELCRRIRRGNLQTPILFYSGLRGRKETAKQRERLARPNTWSNRMTSKNLRKRAGGFFSAKVRNQTLKAVFYLNPESIKVSFKN